MKLIFHLISLGFCLAVIDSALISDLHESLLAYFKTQDNLTESDPLDKSHYLSEDPHSNDKNSQDYNQDTEPPRPIPRHQKDLVDTDYDLIRQMKKQEKWKKKYPYHNDEVNPKQALEEEGDRHNEIKVVNADVAKAKIKTQLLRQFKEKHLAKEAPIFSPSVNSGTKTAQYKFFKDPVLNSLRKQLYRVNFRRNRDPDDSLPKTSSSLEFKDTKEEFRQLWLHKKYEALNKSHTNRGDKVNMVAARPWGVPCGDPNQHDMPWGVCTLPAECDAEFRIIRGDFFCARTQFVCCGYQLLTYDTNQAFDISLDGKSLSTDSEEKKQREKSSKEIKNRQKSEDRRKRHRERGRRKRRIQKQIKKIMLVIQRILKNQYNNHTNKRKYRTKQLQKFIKDMKKQYKKDRQSVKVLHDSNMIDIDTALMDKLKQLKSLNINFSKNSTFRDIVLKGKITKKAARMLLEAYPELDQFLDTRRAGGGKDGPEGGGNRRRSGGGLASKDNESDGDVLEYDVEYGYLYY